MSQGVVPTAGVLLDFPDQTILFREGDPGGDLYFIKSGDVEVYRTVQGLDVRLAILKAGEVLGIMTCLTREPRLASARTLSAVQALVIKQAGIKTLISSTPTWVHTVIKDFTVRVKSIDELYGLALHHIELLEIETSSLRLAMRVAIGIAEIGRLIAKPVGDARVVDIDEALARLASILDVTPIKVANIFSVFVEAGLLKADSQAEVRRADLIVLERLAGFVTLARSYIASTEVRKMMDSMSVKHNGWLLSLCELIKSKKLPAAQEYQWPIANFVVDGFPLESVTANLKHLAEISMVKFCEVSKESQVEFMPGTLLGGVHALMAIAKLRRADQSLTTREGTVLARA